MDWTSGGIAASLLTLLVVKRRKESSRMPPGIQERAADIDRLNKIEFELFVLARRVMRPDARAERRRELVQELAELAAKLGLTRDRL
jgi:hypothetical protein